MRTLDPHHPPADPVLIHDDEALCVISKPTLLLSVPGRGADKADCVVARLSTAHQTLLVVHRLDMETSGLMVFAKTLAAQRHLSQQFAARTVHKTYEAIVTGLITPDTFHVDLPLIADWPNRPRQKVCFTHGKPSETEGHVLDRISMAPHPATRVRLFPKTGRSHQLRVHLLSMGHPILGDSLYADDATFAAAPRLLLHATALTFVHPKTGLALSFQDAAPF